MILSHRWLARHLRRIPDPATVVRGLEQLGIEVVGQEAFGRIYGTVELVEVLARTPHPNSDHLSLVDVRRGDGEVTRIVTGASNGFVGERLWYAPPGTTLPDGRTLGERDLRGIMSPGMLLSAEELGYQAKGGDLWVWEGSEPLGTRFLEVIGGEDVLYELELTPNIAQYLQSVRHIAHDLGAIWDIPVEPLTEAFAYQADGLAAVEAPERCSLYGLVRIAIEPGQVSPLWLQTLLRAVGHRIIHPAVDVTNFVLWDLGEPLHAFDSRQVDGPIVVRAARAGERLTLLDGKELELDARDLVIADQAKPLALAGIMGGLHSGVGDDTGEILLECAHFEAPGIFKSYKRHGIFTDAATHFGKGTDPMAVFHAPSLVIQILSEAGILQKVGGSALVGDLPPERRVPVDADRIRRLLGVDWSTEKIRSALERLGYGLRGESAVVPRYRHDVDSLYDLAEDVARFYGLDAIPRTLPISRTQEAQRDPAVVFEEDLRNRVVEAGFDEVMTRTFSNPEWDGEYQAGPLGSPVQITNPLRPEESLLRRHILPSLLEVVRYNRSRHDLPIHIFEVGPVFSRQGGEIREERELGVVLSLEPIAGYPPPLEPSIYDLTGLADYLFSRMGWAVERRAFTDVPRFLHPGRSQELVAGGQPIGYLGELRPRIAQEYRVKRLGVLVVRLSGLPTLSVSAPGRPSRFPEVQRDLSLVVPDSVAYSAMMQAIWALGLSDLRQIRPIDRFQGDFGTSLTVRLTFQSDATTLTDEGTDEAVRRILASLAALGVGLRQ